MLLAFYEWQLIQVRLVLGFLGVLGVLGVLGGLGGSIVLDLIFLRILGG